MSTELNARLDKITASIEALPQTEIEAAYEAARAAWKASDKSPAARAAFEGGEAFRRFHFLGKVISAAKRAPQAIALDGQNGVNAAGFLDEVESNAQSLA